jgi:lipopolysaccharide transport system ATP-binding protein
MPPVISVENLSKTYRLGQIGTGTFSRDLEVWWAKLRGKPNPMLRIGEKDHGNRDGEELWALRDVSFTVEQGEVLGIIGRNGAGKSTLLKILSRVTAPTSGKIRVKGRIASLLEVGTGFHPELTGRENIYLNGAIMGMNRKDIARKFDEIVDFSEVEKFIDTPVKRYSSGMYVRLAFAVAAHLDPEILVVDEVLAVGDAAFQKKCLGKMGDVAKEGRTVLFVSHNMAAVTNLCLNGLLISKGEIRKKGEIAEVISNYLNSDSEKKAIDFCLKSDEICLFNLNIYQQDENDHNYITDRPLTIEYKYEIKNAIQTGLRIGFDFQSHDGVVIFRSFDDDLITPPRRQKGVYCSKCIIPSDFFMATDYYLIPRIGIHNVKWISENDIRFRISFSHISGVNKNYADSRPGVVMPALEWRIFSND